MNKEVILFIYDFNKFIKESHGLDDYEKYYLGTRAYDFEQLLDIIRCNKDCHIPKEQYEFVMRFFWDNNEHQIDIVEEIKKRIQ